MAVAEGTPCETVCPAVKGGQSGTVTVRSGIGSGRTHTFVHECRNI